METERFLTLKINRLLNEMKRCECPTKRAEYLSKIEALNDIIKLIRMNKIN